MIKVGDIVTLKSGSPKMTVGKIIWNKAHLFHWQKRITKYSYGNRYIDEYTNEFLSREIVPIGSLEIVN